MRSFITDPVTGGVAALIVTVATVIAMYVALFGSPFSRGSEGKTATRNVTGSFYGSTPAEPAPARDATSPKTGDCLTDSFTYSNCSSQHKFEIYQVPPHCTEGDLIMYMGGDPQIEVLRARSAQVPVGKPTVQACVVQADGDTHPNFSAKGVLSSAAGSFWRRCQDRRTGQSTVSCADEHTGEYVRVQAGTSVDQSSCERATDAYLGAGLSRLGDRLVMRVLADSPPTSDQPHCLVETRGPELLTASIRNIRTYSPAFKPMSYLGGREAPWPSQAVASTLS
jgi:hypothetical protein